MAAQLPIEEALALLSEQAKRKDITNLDLDALAEQGQALYDGKNKGTWNAFKIFFAGMTPSYRRSRMQNEASHKELKYLISNRKEENKLVAEPESLGAVLTDKPVPLEKTPARTKNPDKPAKKEAAGPKLSKKYEKLSDKLAVLKQQATKETLPAKMKALSNYPLLSSDISKETSVLKNLLKLKGKNPEASLLLKEQLTLLETLKKQVDLASAQLAKRIESMSNAKK